jgi:hypothetical protein
MKPKGKNVLQETRTKLIVSHQTAPKQQRKKINHRERSLAMP